MGAINCCEQKQAPYQSPKKTKNNPKSINDASKTPQSPNLSSQKIFENEEISKINDARDSKEVDLSQNKKVRGPEDYQHLKYLGKGAFGCVVLVQEKATNKKYAMKIIEKSKITQFNLLQCDRIKLITHEDFLVAIRETFQNQTKIYIIMDYLPMGDLYYYLNKKDVPFPQESIVNIASEIILGLEILHKQGIVYRELKPQNILVTEDGHIKLTDYSLSKVLAEQSNLISTFVGTLEYMAPEVYSGTFGQKADLWSLGIILHELLFKQNLFQIEDHKILEVLKKGEFPVQKNIITDRINAKIGCMSIQFRSLLLRLLQMDPDSRISLAEIKEHQFFKDVDWEQVRRRQNDPPLKEIKNKKDIIKFRDPASEQYFRQEFIKKNHQQNYEFQLFQFRNSH